MPAPQQLLSSLMAQIQRPLSLLKQWFKPLAALPPWLRLPGGARFWVTLLSLGFLLAALKGNTEQVLAQRLDPQGWLWLVIGVGLSLFSLVINGLGWAVGLRWFRLRPRWGLSVRAYLSTNLLKYLPGGIWHLAERVRLLGQGDRLLRAPTSAVATPLALAATLLDPLLAASAALAIAAAAGWRAGWPLLGLLPLLLLVPRWFQPLLQRLERSRERQLTRAQAARGLESSALPPQDPAAGGVLLPGYPLVPLLVLGLFVLLRFGGFAACVLAFDQQLSLPWAPWLLGFALAWTAGLVVPGAPGGLGVFEAVLLVQLGGQVAEAPLLAVALSYRLVVTAADLLAALTARLDGSLERPRRPATSADA
ncbi:lysylphosphatidylglycerol synthase domain-containing protein [Synechococcus sp. RedBA-s]|uniref:lysylphosphatidylglycerol synthase domain-containing protein n=1 Tax=Synechococcus sp. RedBA-s TaxID=2823741 RepID=UPI0020CF28D5|nr:lysylphosphatidylglycerol synthase domain-containing protein [Synechococcus sp. RedBA-s]MCP9799432.1 flippase-like domain-containing protein [Synechococcus sp. RedBA-s]